MENIQMCPYFLTVYLGPEHSVNRNIGYVDNTSLANGTERSDTPCPERWYTSNIFFIASNSKKVKHQ